MALSSRKITTYANPVANLPDHPSQAGFTAAQLKAAFDAIANQEVKTAINGIIDDLLAVTDSGSGADNIGLTAIADLNGTTVQAVIESLRNKLKSVVDGTSGADFVAATAISGISGATVQALLEALKSYIDTHKTSSDHDSRYYTETELNATNGVTGSAIIGTPVINGVNGTTVKDQLASLKSLITSVALGQIPDDSLTNVKLGSDVKVGSLANLTTDNKLSVVEAINEHETQINSLDAKVDLKANKTQPAWITATLQNGWTGTLQYRKNQIGQLEIKGNMTVGTITSGTVLATFPTDYRPTVNTPMPIYNTLGKSTLGLVLLSTGAISLYSPTTDFATGNTVMIDTVFPL